MPKFSDPKQQRRLAQMYKREEEELVRILSDKYKIPYLDLSFVSINSDALRLVPEKKAREAGIAFFSISGKKLKGVILSPKKEDLVSILSELKRKGYKVSLYMTTKTSINKAWKVYKEISLSKHSEAGVFDISSSDLVEFSKKVKNLSRLKELFNDVITKTDRYKISRFLEIVLAGAIAIKASDIHIEPEKNNIHLRYRIDGVLYDIGNFSYDIERFITSRIKLLSGLKLNIKKDAQDGRFSINFGEKIIEIRTSIIPGNYGESIVLRLLDPENIAVSFEELGIDSALFDILSQEIKKPNGMVLTTGPTGSGKTTTLYSILKKIYSPGIKIITIEDPIEYHLEGITQTQVEKTKGYTFSQGLSSILRQDPDIIMVGEIRDADTARIAINASLTGHLVLSTLHTNNAAGVIPRLIDLGINPKVISSSLNISLAQRLVRKLCPDCKKEVMADEKETSLIKNILDTTKRDIAWSGKIWKANEGGCEKCRETGYKKRIGIFEGILTDEKIDNILMLNPSEREIKKVSSEQGILNMKQDGIIKVIKGVTSLEELERVVDLRE